ncbi:MAG: hypothetical protein ABIW79_02140 [Gemmatimonas sp.]
MLLACARGDAPPADSAAPGGAGATSTAAPAAPVITVDRAMGWKVRADGVRGAIFGRTSAMTRMALALDSAPAFAKGTCQYLDAPKLPVKLMFVSDTLVRVDVRDTTVTTMEGARVGDTEARINELFAGRVTTTPHKYTGPQGHYLTVTFPMFSESFLVFETDGERVTTYRAGRKPEVEWVEGCS